VNILKFLNDNKKLVGMSDWTVTVCKTAGLGDHIAEVNIDIYENTLEVTPSHDFHKKTEKQKREILIHELIHARLLFFQRKSENLIRLDEEMLVDDLTRGVGLLWKQK
jgi:hypothetical protein